MLHQLNKQQWTREKNIPWQKGQVYPSIAFQHSRGCLLISRRQAYTNFKHEHRILGRLQSVEQTCRCQLVCQRLEVSICLVHGVVLQKTAEIGRDGFDVNMKGLVLLFIFCSALQVSHIKSFHSWHLSSSSPLSLLEPTERSMLKQDL